MPKLNARSIFVAIVGGSGAGKSWLAEKLEQALPGLVSRLSQDDFYLDRAHLTPARRARINFDHPRAIDWKSLEDTLKNCLAGKLCFVPRYDFSTHTRLTRKTAFRPKPIVLVEGLWLLHRPPLRRLFTIRIFLDCPQRTRLTRRIKRDQLNRGRSRSAVVRQFQQTVQPMHRRYVIPQARWATVKLKPNWGEPEIKNLARHIQEQALKPD